MIDNTLAEFVNITGFKFRCFSHNDWQTNKLTFTVSFLLETSDDKLEVTRTTDRFEDAFRLAADIFRSRITRGMPEFLPALPRPIDDDLSF